jgi:SprT-like family protein
MFRAISRLLWGRDPGQLTLELESPPRDAEELLVRLRALGLARIRRCRLTRNRSVMVSYSGNELRVHAGYLRASRVVHEAIVRFVEGRTHAERREAQRVIVGYQVEASQRMPLRRRRTRPEDEVLARRLTEWHRLYNDRYFGGRLRAIPIRVSRRMKSRLGHYTAASPTGEHAEIAISRKHLRRHGWEEALHTLLHEMIHQWQDEEGHLIDHGPTFRRKARELRIAPSAKRAVEQNAR